MRTRDNRIHIYLNKEESDRLDEICRRTGLKRSTVVRKLIEGAEVKELPPIEAQAILIEVRRIGNNINQIAAIVNAGMGVHKSEYKKNWDALMAVLEKLQQQLYIID